MSDYPRVLLISFSAVPAPDRHGVQLHNVIKALAPRYELDVMSLRAGDLPYVEKYLNARMLRVPVGDVSVREQVEVFRRAVRRQVEGNEYEVIHFRSAYGGKPVCERKEYMDSKLVFEVAISPLAQPRPADVVLSTETDADERFCFDKADLVLASSTLAADHLKVAGRFMRGEIKKAVNILPQGVDVDFFDWEELPPQKGLHVIYTGHIGPGRGIRILLKAMAEVISQVDAHLVLVGQVEKGFEATLATSIDELNIRHRVTLVGSVKHSDMPRMLALADVCVAPSVPHSGKRPLAGYPNKVLEAMACRKAVVVPYSPLMEEIAFSPSLLAQDSPDLILSGAGKASGRSECFGFFRKDSAGDMAGVIIRLLTDEGLRGRVADAAYHRVRSAFTASGTRRRLLAAYRKLIPVPGSELFQARPGLNQVPGVFSADPETSTARKFHEFHDTATVSGPPPQGGWTPTGKRAPTIKMRPVNESSPEEEKKHSDTGTLPNYVADEDGARYSHPHEESEGELPEITPDDVVEVVEAGFVAEGEFLSDEVHEDGASQFPAGGTKPETPTDSEGNPDSESPQKP